jgi:hypothetical protein
MRYYEVAKRTKSTKYMNNPTHQTLAPRLMLAPQQMVGAQPGLMGITKQVTNLSIINIIPCAD